MQYWISDHLKGIQTWCLNNRFPSLSEHEKNYSIISWHYCNFEPSSLWSRLPHDINLHSQQPSSSQTDNMCGWYIHYCTVYYTVSWKRITGYSTVNNENDDDTFTKTLTMNGTVKQPRFALINLLALWLPVILYTRQRTWQKISMIINWFETPRLITQDLKKVQYVHQNDTN